MKKKKGTNTVLEVQNLKMKLKPFKIDKITGKKIKEDICNENNNSGN